LPPPFCAAPQMIREHSRICWARVRPPRATPREGDRPDIRGGGGAKGARAGGMISRAPDSAMRAISQGAVDSSARHKQRGNHWGGQNTAGQQGECKVRVGVIAQSPNPDKGAAATAQAFSRTSSCATAPRIALADWTKLQASIRSSGQCPSAPPFKDQVPSDGFRVASRFAMPRRIDRLRARGPSVPALDGLRSCGALCRQSPQRP